MLPSLQMEQSHRCYEKSYVKAEAQSYTSQVSVILNQMPTFKKSRAQTSRCDQQSTLDSSYYWQSRTISQLFFYCFLTTEEEELCPDGFFIWDKEELRIFRQLFLVC